MRIHRLITLLALIYSSQATCQGTGLYEKEIDALFSEWQQKDHPGGVVGVLQGDHWIYKKAFGNANLEYDIPMTLDTRINVASISKQVSALCMVKLALDKRLNLDDDIHKYLEFLPDFGQVITIRHLLHHTSGLRSLHALLEIAGWREDDPRSTEDLNRLMALQTELNFAPGEAHLYCNTGYIFMAQIVEKITGERFENWCKREILTPLGMSHSFIEKDYSEIQKNRATSYYKSGSYFKQAVPFWGYVGSGNMHTTLEDLMRWYGNYLHPTKGWQEAFEMLQTKGILNNGDTLDYAMGIEIDDFLGHKRIQHGGAVGGFRAFACAFPEDDLRVIVMSNFSSSDPMGKVEQISSLFLKDVRNEEVKKLKTVKLKTVQLRQYAGQFYNQEAKFTREIQLLNDTLWYVRNAKSRDPLRPVGKDLFELDNGNARFLIKFGGSEGSFDHMLVGYNEAGTGSFTRFEPVNLNEERAAKLVGTWYSPELECTYEIRWEKNALYAWHIRFGKIPIDILKENVFQANWPLGTLECSPAEGNYTEFRASNGRVMNLRFVRQNP